MKKISKNISKHLEILNQEFPVELFNQKPFVKIKIDQQKVIKVTPILIKVNSVEWCPICKSSQHYKYGLIPSKHCINPECVNYYKRKE